MTDPGATIDVEDLREKFLGTVFDECVVTLNPEEIAQYALSCGETAPKFLDPSDSNFQAPPTIASSFNPKKSYPDGFPKIAGLGMDAGKSVTLEKPIRAGQEITLTTSMHDIYTKSGRSGRMVFFVNRTTITDSQGAALGASDTSVVIREKPEESQ